MKYFRVFPFGLQLLLFLLMSFTFISTAGVMIASLLPKLAGISASQLGAIDSKTPASIVNITLIIEGASNLFVWLLPAFIFAYLAHPEPRKYLGLRAPGKTIQPILAVLMILGAMPVLEWLEGLISLIPFPSSVKAGQQASEEMMNAFLNMPSFASFIRVFLIMAIIPAMGEEMFFRGVLLRFAKKKSRGMAFPIVFTALIFSFAHANVYGFISIFLAGVLLAVIYNLTGSLWCSILAHLFFNGTQIILSYIGSSNAAVKAFVGNNTTPYYLVVGGAVVFGVSLYLLLKNKTPLPPDWAEDFDKAPANFSWEENQGENNN